MTDEPTTAHDIVATILDCCPSRQSVEALRDTALKSGGFTPEEQALIIEAANVRFMTLRSR